MNGEPDPLESLRRLEELRLEHETNPDFTAWCEYEDVFTNTTLQPAIDLITRMRKYESEAEGTIDVQREEIERLRERVRELEGLW